MGLRMVTLTAISQLFNTGFDYHWPSVDRHIIMLYEVMTIELLFIFSLCYKFVGSILSVLWPLLLTWFNLNPSMDR